MARDKVGIHQVTQRAVFLDRDGIINRSIVRNGKPYPPASIDELELIDGIGTVLKAVQQSGFLLIVVTNQPDVARGKTKASSVEAIHDFLKSKLALDGIYVCYHDDADRCDCRKPKPGLLQRAARDFGIDLASSYMVGDRWRDIDAGAAAGCRTIFVDYQYDEKLRAKPDFTIQSPLDIPACINQLSKVQK